MCGLMEKNERIPPIPVSARMRRLLAQRAKEILTHRHPMDVGDLADALGLSKITVYRFLRKLMAGVFDPKVQAGTAIAILRAVAPEALEEISTGLLLEVKDYVIPEEMLGMFSDGSAPLPPEGRFVRPQNASGDLLALEEFPPKRDAVRLLVVRRDAPPPLPGREVVVLRAGLDPYILRRAPLREGERLVGVVVERLVLCRDCAPS